VSELLTDLGLGAHRITSHGGHEFTVGIRSANQRNAITGIEYRMNWSRIYRSASTERMLVLVTILDDEPA